MLPREHGAYSQMALPLVTSFVVAGATPPAALTGLAVFLGFLAHEPLMVLLGRRGARARHDSAGRARALVAATGAAALAAGLTAVVLAPAGVRWSFGLPLVPALVVAGGLFSRQEKSAPAEVAVALAFSLAAVPTSLAAGASTSTAVSLGVVFALVFVAGVLAVRVVILRVRGGGRPRAVRATRALLLALGGGAAVVLAVTAARGVLPWTPLLATAPGLVAALSLALRRTPPALKTVGWTLMSMSTAAAAILAAGL